MMQYSASPNSTAVFTASELQTLTALERMGGSASLVAVALVFVAYGLFARLRTVANTLLVLASVANVGASAAFMISYAGLRRGPDSALCQAQAFLLEM